MAQTKKATKQLKLTLVRSLIGRLPKHRATADALGLRRMHKFVIIDDNPTMRGMVQQISYLLKVEEI